METQYQINSLAIFTEADSPGSRALILEMAKNNYDFFLNTSKNGMDEVF